MELALGTAQFGLAYGIAGRTAPLDDSAARAVLEAAAHHGIRWLDTASAYGDIEERLSYLCVDLPFHIVSKLPALPPGLNELDSQKFFLDALRRSIVRLGHRLSTVLFHEPADLAGPEGETIWLAVESETAVEGIKLGVSCYDLATLHSLQARLPISAAQLPGNAFDQSLTKLEKFLAPNFLQVRSAFLQGLLLMPEQEASRRLPAAAAALKRWHDWCKAEGKHPLEAALGIVKGFSVADQCVIGVDDGKHLEQIVAAWSKSCVVTAPELSVQNSSIIDPRQWRLTT
jgi:aryl-alcohol dehydrogenase-like predicted oxidoreductase